MSVCVLLEYIKKIFFSESINAIFARGRVLNIDIIPNILRVLSVFFVKHTLRNDIYYVIFCTKRRHKSKNQYKYYIIYLSYNRMNFIKI